jgi:fucose 4-O-acetylase-like acetyltransferase
MLFALLIVVFTMKFSVHNKVLTFLGKHLFEIYILQRLPMRLIPLLGVSNKYIYTVLSFAATLALAVLFSYIYKKLDSVIYKQKKGSR